MHKLAEGLKLVVDDRSYRCGCCNKMQHAGDQVMVPDGVMKGDPAWSVTEKCKRSSFNGEWSGWCVECASSFVEDK